MKFVQITKGEKTATVSEIAAKHFEARGWEVAGEAAGPGGPVLFDPQEHNVDDVLAYLEGVSPEERERVIAAEVAGKARVSITNA